MKKTLLLILALMPSLLLHSQEADSGNFTELSIFGRFEATPSYNPLGKGYEFTHGDSSIYSLFEGQYNNLNWTVSTHFINAGGDYGWLYKSLGYSNTFNFLDYLYLGYTFGNFTVNVGKDVMRTGGIEFQEWDWEIHSLFASPLWNLLPCYQWGVSVDWAPSDNNTFTFQVNTSPFGEKPFKSKLYAYTFQWLGSIDWVSFAWSGSAIGKGPKQYDYLIALGETFSFTDNIHLSFDWNNTYSVLEDGLIRGNTIKLKLLHKLNEKSEFFTYFMYSIPKEKIFQDIFNAGITYNYYPIPDLRLNVSLAFEHNQHIAYLNIGALYNLRLIK